MKPRKMEKGDMLTYFVTSMFVLFFMFSLLYLWMCYAKIVQLKLDCNDIAKKYLYIMEQNGGLTSAEINALKADLVAVGADTNSIDLSGSTIPSLTGISVNYGDKITLQIEAKAQSPMYSLMRNIFKYYNIVSSDATFDNTYKWVTIHVRKTSTARY